MLSPPPSTRPNTAPRSNSFRLIAVRSIPSSAGENGEPRRGHFYPSFKGTLSSVYNIRRGGRARQRAGEFVLRGRRQAGWKEDPWGGRRQRLPISFTSLL